MKELSIENLHVTIADQKIVRGLTLRVPRGEVHAIMDVSGNISAILNQKGGNIFSVSPQATVFEAVSLLAEKNIGAVLVIDGEKLVGLVSERDYTRKVMLRGKRSRETTVAEIMNINQHFGIR